MAYIETKDTSTTEKPPTVGPVPGGIGPNNSLSIIAFQTMNRVHKLSSITNMLNLCVQPRDMLVRFHVFDDE